MKEKIIKQKAFFDISVRLETKTRIRLEQEKRDGYKQSIAVQIDSLTELIKVLQEIEKEGK